MICMDFQNEAIRSEWPPSSQPGLHSRPGDNLHLHLWAQKAEHVSDYLLSECVGFFWPLGNSRAAGEQCDEHPLWGMWCEESSSPAISFRWIMQHFPWQVSGVGGSPAPVKALVSTPAPSERGEQQMPVTKLHKLLCFKRMRNFYFTGNWQLSFLSLSLPLQLRQANAAFL